MGRGFPLCFLTLLVIIEASDVTQRKTAVAPAGADVKVAQESQHYNHHHQLTQQDDHHRYYDEQETKIYDAYFGKPLSEKRNSFLQSNENYTLFYNADLLSNVTGERMCTVEVKPCRKEEGRRVDGTCINPHYPSRGASLTPFHRLLPPSYGPGNSLRPARDGSELPSTRLIRTTLLASGYFRDHDFTQLGTHVFVFSFVDNADLFYLLRYTLVSDCCIGNQIRNEANPACIPIEVPRDDPYLRRTGIRCMNLTRVLQYQDYGCIPRTLPAARHNRVTPLLDLSVIYGNNEQRNREIRANQSGLLSFRMEGNREVPAGQSPFCVNNQPPEETVCYNFGDNYQGVLLSGIYITALWFFREHNRIARKLAEINPCWDDEQLFQTARKINIAQYQYIYYYELVGEFIGRKNALAEGVIYDTHGHVNDFDPKIAPGVFREYIIGCRWFHTYQGGLNDLYRNHEYKGSRTVVDDSLRTGYLPLNNSEADLNEGAIIQPGDHFDKIIDPDLVQRAINERQTASDLVAIDMMRGRDAGLQPYNYYRKLCGMKIAEKFEDFEDTIDKDKVEQLSRLYEDVDDVDLMAAIYVENLLPNAWVGPTLYCIMVQNLLLWRKSDKFFFEHGGFPAALTEGQLKAVKTTSIARILCDSGDSIKTIQPKAFRKLSSWNKFVPCKEIPGIDLNYWRDRKCPKEEENLQQSSITN